jgi:hypothetical protein
MVRLKAVPPSLQSGVSEALKLAICRARLGKPGNRTRTPLSRRRHLESQRHKHEVCPRGFSCERLPGSAPCRNAVRGQAVVIETNRGIEVGEVLIPLDQSPAVSQRSRVLRPAGPDDLASSHRAEAMRPDRLLLCRRGLEDGNWPGEPIDVEMTSMTAPPRRMRPTNQVSRLFGPRTCP